MVFLGKHGCTGSFALFCKLTSSGQDPLDFRFNRVHRNLRCSFRRRLQLYRNTLFIFDLLLLLSLFISAWLFFKRKDVAIKFALAQEVFRLISFRCSVSFFPLLVSVFGITSVWVNLGLFVISELLKIYSLVYLMGKRKRNHSL